MREEDLRKLIKPLIAKLDKIPEVIGTSLVFDKDVECFSAITLLDKKSKLAPKVSNLIQDATGDTPEILKKGLFPYLTWEYFGEFEDE